jgi:hypothetical protein
MNGGIHFTEPLLPMIEGIHTQTHKLMGFMKYATEMGSGAMIFIPSFIKIGPGIQKLIGEIHRHTDRMTIS